MEGRRRITLYDQMTASSSRGSLASIMLDDVVFKQAEASRSRTLQDIIREEKPNGHAKDRNSWKAFKERLRLKRGSAWSSTVNHNDHNSNNSNDEENGNSNLPETQQNDVVNRDAADLDPISGFGSPTENEAAGDSSEGENNHEAVVGVSLMDLLEEAEPEMDLYRAVSDEDDEVAEYKKREEEEKEEKEKEKEKGVVEYSCCVCMVRHKGAAFIPCGHTFCRMCSREIWVSRGNCPLCNNIILEILDIF